MHTVLIADDDKNFVDVLGKKIGEDPSFEIVAKVCDGKNTIEQIMLLRPDILLLDIVMPNSDGVYIVEFVRSQMHGYNPVVYILSGIGTTSIIKTLNGLNVDFFSLKPVQLEVIMSNLKNVSAKHDAPARPRRPELQDKSSLIEGLTTQLGISPHRKSTQCVNEALKYCIDNPEGTRLVTKILYPEIARRHGLSSSTVERNIRHAISSIQKARTTTYLRMFSYAEGKKITNSEFLAVVSEYVTMNQMLK